MSTRNHRVRFMTNNMAVGATITASSEQAAFPLTNLTHEHRFRKYKPAGNFTINASNKNIYIDDGSNKTVALTEDSYTYSSLAAHIETALNASSSNWTASYDFDGGTYKFTLSNSGSVTLRLTQTTNAAWDTLGFTGSSDDTGTSFVADEQRNHTSEWIKINFGGAQTVTAFCLIGMLAETFSLSSSAVVTLQGNSVDSYVSPPVDRTVVSDALGAFDMLDELSNTDYQYWLIEIVDRTNPLGPEGIELNHLYLGDYITLTRRNVSSGFQFQIIDPSKSVKSDQGAEWFGTRRKYMKFDNGQILYLDSADAPIYQQMAYDLGLSTSFYISLDPTLLISSSLSKFTRYVRFSSEPAFIHNKANIWSFTSMSFNEVV